MYIVQIEYFLLYLSAVTFRIHQKRTSSLPQQNTEGKDWKHQLDRTENHTGTKTVVMWTTYYFHNVVPDLTTWRHCPNDIKGSCVLTSNRSKYEVCIIYTMKDMYQN